MKTISESVTSRRTGEGALQLLAIEQLLLELLEALTITEVVTSSA
jgi:hypothetical protein